MIIKYGPSFKYQIPDSYIKFNEDLFKKGYPLSKGELSYINSENEKIIIKSKNDFIILLKFIRDNPYIVKLFYEHFLYDSIIYDLQFDQIENVYSDLNIEDSNLGLGKMIQYDQNFNTLNTINEIENDIDKGSLFMASKILSDLFKKKLHQNIINYMKNLPKKPIKLKYNIPSVESLLNNNKLIFFENDNDDILNFFSSNLEQIENKRNNNLILQTMINVNVNSKLSNINQVNNSNINNVDNNKIFNTEITQSTLYEQIGFECKNCHIKPLKNKRYKCPKCINYNLCEICEEKNVYKHFHPHGEFILIRIKETNLAENPYSYQCLTKNLFFNIKKEEIQNDEIIIKKILIKNNFILPWPGNKNSFFKCNKALSTIFCEKIILPNLNLGNTVNIDFHFKKIKKIPKGNYVCIIDFIINGDKYGNPLEIYINLI
jgi:hypothetical protein